MDFLENIVTNGMLTTVNCKAIGPTYAANIVYSYTACNNYMQMNFFTI